MSDNPHSTPHSGIYVIVNTKNGKVYVGQAQDFNARWRRHRTALNGNYHRNRHLQSAWNKYGAKTFKFLKLEYCPIEQLNEREQHHINVYMAKGICYNIAPYADAPMRGRKMSEETKEKLRQANLGKKLPPMSEETRRKMSESQTGKVLSEETRRKMSEVNKGKHHSIESRLKMSIAKTGSKHSEEHRRKNSEAQRNRPPMSEETRRKMSEAQKGNKNSLGCVHSEETLRKLREAQKMRRARERGELE